MPNYQIVPLDFEPWVGSIQPVFRRSKETFRATEVRQDKPADGSARQAYFEGQLRRISAVTPDGLVPVFTRWNDGIGRRLDLGCIGHSVRRNVIERPQNDPIAGFVSHIALR